MHHKLSNDPISIITSGDENYLPHVAAMLHSLFASNPSERFNVYFLHSEKLKGEHLDKLKGILRNNKDSLTSVAVGAGLFGKMPVTSDYPEEAWYRLKLPELLPNLERVLWLDADTIVRRSIRPLWATNLGGKKLAAVPNPLSPAMQTLVKNLALPSGARYFNSGVMLCDLKRLSSKLSGETVNIVVARFNQHIRYADQDVLNILFTDDWLPIHPRWNFVSSALLAPQRHNQTYGLKMAAEARADPAVVHFTTPEAKPWLHKSFHPYREAYLYHRRQANYPPPSFDDRTLKTTFLRHVPFKARATMSALRNGNWRQLAQLYWPNTQN